MVAGLFSIITGISLLSYAESHVNRPGSEVWNTVEVAGLCFVYGGIFHLIGGHL